MKALLRAALATAATIAIAGCSSSRPAEVNGEQVPANEAAATTATLASFRAMVEHEYAAGQRPAPRDAHAKGQGCMRATVTIDPHLPADLRHGVFSSAHTYAAWIRMSNGAPVRDPDGMPDGRGMAIKLVGVDGPKLIPDELHTQDFLMIDFPVFFSATVADYAGLANALEHGTVEQFVTTHPQTGRIIAAMGGQTVDNLFNQRYFSMSPYKLGSTYVKFAARPAPCPIVSHLGSADMDDPNGLRAQMVSDLSRGDACYELQLQPRTDPASMPIEDASALWDESKAPFVDAAFVDIPKQTFDSAAQQKFCEENLSFTPWHGTTDFRPVGGINRLRLVAYRAGSQLRHALNHAKSIEPTGDERF